MGESDATSSKTQDLTFEGDRELASQAQNLLAKTCPAAAVARITPTEVSYATRKANQDSVFEIGSVTKGITGMLYHEALTRQEITTDSTLGDFLPLAGSPAAHVTLASITTHRSGLPRLLKTRGHLGRMLAYAFRGKNPYQDSLETTIHSARKARLKTPKPTYSNWAFDLLGHSLAAAANTNYRELVLERIAKPLKLESICLPYDLSEWPNRGVQPCDKEGDPYEPWTGEASLPCGGIAANIVDLVTLAQAILDGTAPGVAACDAIEDFPAANSRIGAGWLTTVKDGRNITWHNGATGGCMSWFGMDRSTHEAVVVLAATDADVTAAGFTILLDNTTANARSLEPKKPPTGP